MQVSQQDLIAIVEKASTLTERLGNQFIPDRAQVNDKLINSRASAWCQGVAKGNLENFAKRLVWDNVDSSSVSALLGPVRLVEPKQQLPVWAETLQEALNTDWELACASASRCLDTEKPIPFEEVYLPFVYVVQKQLIARVGYRWQLLSEASHICLERHLLLKLASLCAKCLKVEFSLFKESKQSTFTLSSEQEINSNQHYQIFINDQKTNKLLPFFQKYNVLARLVGTAMTFWVEEKAEFLQRLALDLPIIQKTFSEDTGLVVAIKANLSDLHNRGRSVIALTFASGLKLIYKSRDLSLETAYFNLLTWFNQQEILLPFKIVKVIDCTTHGWMEYVEHLPCEDEEAAQRYYQRAGMLLSLLYVLQGIDFHQENLIASGEHPVLVDLETLLQPEACEINPKTEEMGGALYLASQLCTDSVLRSGLLPRWEFTPEGMAVDDSGLGGVSEQEIPVCKQKWQNINTDSMTLEYEPGIMSLEANTVFLNGVILSPNDYVNEIVNGFQKMYQFLIDQREVFLAADSPLAALAYKKVRFLFRNSQLYANILQKAQQPKFLQHGIDYSIKLDVLSRALLAVDCKPPAWSLLAMELQALEQMDIPYFIANSSTNALMLNYETVIEGYFKESSYDRMVSRFGQLSDRDLTQQIAIIRGSFYSRVARGMSSVASTDYPSAVLDLDVTAPLVPTELVQEAMKIAKELQQRGIQAANGSATWIGMDYNPDAQRYQLQPLGYDLYNGVCGVALFLAAMAKISGDAKLRDLALSALQDLRESLQNTGDSNFQRKIIETMDIGGGFGHGSIIYTLVKVSEFLDEPDLLDIACLAASLITKESIERDRSFDIISGAAGAILGLLALYQVKPNSDVLNLAQALGYHLLNNRTQSETGFRAWATLEGKLATGFSHGAAGITYALLRLYKTAQDPVFLEAAEEAIAYERSVFSPTDGNWPDVRNFSLNKSKPSFMTNWCHGAPGIGLARLGSLMILDTAEIRQEIAVAINTTQQFGLHNVDHLCCGNFGRMEVLLVGACKLPHPDLWNTVQKQAAWVIARAKQVGSFSLFSELPRDVYNPGFFQGSAGIGYELLRLAYPGSLPSVLLWE